MAIPRLRHILTGIILMLALLISPTLPASAQQSDSERLGMALDYFQSGKYHEALLIFQKLDKSYNLNPRFQAYIGVCYYYEWEYKLATRYLDSVIPKLAAFSPQERSFYYFADAESHFYLEQYDQALPLYEAMIALCKENEKPDAYYKIGFIHSFREEWIAALDNYQNSLVYYKQLRPNEKARITQIHKMIQGCCDKINSVR